MQGFHRRVSIVAAVAAGLGWAGSAPAEFATSVQSFDQGTVDSTGALYGNPASATGQPSRLPTAFGAAPVAPFSPQYETTQAVDVGRGGSLTVSLAAPVPVVAGALQIGIFTTAGLNDAAYPSGQAEPTARTFAGNEYGADRTAVVEVAGPLGIFQSLNRVLFTQPTQAYANQTDPYAFPDSPVPSNFDQPFAGSLSSFNGKNQPQITTMLQGSGGGTWLSVPADVAALIGGEVQFVRISDPRWQVIGGGLADERASIYDPDGDGPLEPAVKPADLYVDAINVVPEPASLGVIAALCLALHRRHRRQAI